MRRVRLRHVLLLPVVNESLQFTLAHLPSVVRFRQLLLGGRQVFVEALAMRLAALDRCSRFLLLLGLVCSPCDRCIQLIPSTAKDGTLILSIWLGRCDPMS